MLHHSQVKNAIKIDRKILQKYPPYIYYEKSYQSMQLYPNFLLHEKYFSDRWTFFFAAEKVNSHVKKNHQQPKLSEFFMSIKQLAKKLTFPSLFDVKLSKPWIVTPKFSKYAEKISFTIPNMQIIMT